MAGFVKILLRANFNQANLKTDIISQIYSDNKLLLNDVPDNKEPTQEPKNRKVNVHLQTNVGRHRHWSCACGVYTVRSRPGSTADRHTERRTPHTCHLPLCSLQRRLVAKRSLSKLSGGPPISDRRGMYRIVRPVLVLITGGRIWSSTG